MGANFTKIDDETLRKLPTEQVQALSEYMRLTPKQPIRTSTNNDADVSSVYNYTSTRQRPIEYKGEYQNNIKKLVNQIEDKNRAHTSLTDIPFSQTVPGKNPTLSYQRAVSTYYTEPVRPGINKLIGLESVGSVNNIGDDKSLTSLINFCESYKVNRYDSSICNAFNNEKFRMNCGVCLKPTSGPGDRTHIGGMFIDPDTRAAFTSDSDSLSQNAASPTIGMCSPGYFVLDNKECKLVDANKKCKESANYDNPGCAQCLIDGNWHYLENTTKYSTPKLVVKGVGKLVVTKSTGQKISEVTLTETDNVINIELNSLEGDILYITVTQLDETQYIYLAGYLTGPTLTGSFSSDLARLIDSDLITNAKPRIIGFQQMTAGSQAVKMTSGINNPQMKLVLRVPYSFISPDELSSDKCTNGPVIRTNQSANSLGFNKCKDQQSGSYNEGCLQDIFIRGGCNEKGSLYPSSSYPNRIQELNSLGSSTDQILQKIQEMSAISITGRNMNGSKVTAEERNTASTKCHGISMSNVCELVDQNGRVSPECLSYLYKNQGVANTIGSTYSTVNASSLLGTMTGYDVQFCTDAGKINPSASQSAISRAMAHTLNGQKGSVSSVKDFYNNIHRIANASITDTNRESIVAAIRECYGIEIPADGQQQQQQYLDIVTYPSNNIIGGGQQQQQGFQNFAENSASTFTTNKTIRGRDVPFVYKDNSIQADGIYAKWVN